MVFMQENRIKSSSTDDEAVEETLITNVTIDEEANMTREKVKMEEVREENERLKLTLSRMMKDYHSLKEQIHGITQEDQPKKPTDLAPMSEDDDEDSELVSLSLGRSSSDSKKRKNNSNNNSLKESKKVDGIELGLNNFSEDSMNLKADENRSDDSKEDGSNDVRSSRKSPIKNSGVEDEELLQNSPLKKPRVSVRAVCNTQTMHDGCQWRKYGQKIAKGNPCPRAYYRCTVSSSCPVRKQVQRSIDDMSILVTTYEGTHNHPLPPSATTMASATTAAVAMLNCGSTTSPPPTTPSLFGFTNTFPRATISTSQSHPTVILDLTPPNHTNKFSSTPFSTAPTSLNFSVLNNTSSSPYSRPPFLSAIQTQTASDKIAAATKAITHDPSFQSALAAAITSFVQPSRMNFHLNFSQPSSTSTVNASIGCAATFMNRYHQHQPMNSQQKSLTHFAPLTFSASKSRAVALADEGEQMKL